MARAQVRLFEADSRPDCEAEANAFLAGLPLAALLDVRFGMGETADGSWRRYWMLVVYKEA